MTIDAKKIALLHVAQKKLDLDDDHWRRLLTNIGGVASSKDLDQQGFEAMMVALEALGWKSTFGEANFGNLRDWPMATPGQIALIKDLWCALHGGDLDPIALDKWLSRFGVDSIRFLTRDLARKVIAGLRSWKSRVAAREAS